MPFLKKKEVLSDPYRHTVLCHLLLPREKSQGTAGKIFSVRQIGYTFRTRKLDHGGWVWKLILEGLTSCAEKFSILFCLEI